MRPDIAEFLRARLDERGERAKKLLRYAQENDLAVRDPRLLGRVIPGWHEWPEVEQMAREVLADVDADRRIMELTEEATGLDIQVDGEFRVGSRDTKAEPYVGDLILRWLALPYAGHEDYRDEWRPDED